ncbi:MAG: hypothetical protein JWO87_2248 [Phycisphaerales bacterium]|nr:hypothetical protein [Phycisphaerales bacterium]
MPKSEWARGEGNISDLKSQIWDLRSGIWDFKLQSANFKMQIEEGPCRQFMAPNQLHPPLPNRK